MAPSPAGANCARRSEHQYYASSLCAHTLSVDTFHTRLSSCAIVSSLSSVIVGHAARIAIVGGG